MIESIVIDFRSRVILIVPETKIVEYVSFTNGSIRTVPVISSMTAIDIRYVSPSYIIRWASMRFMRMFICIASVDSVEDNAVC